MPRRREVSEPNGAFHLYPVAGVDRHNPRPGLVFERVANLTGKDYCESLGPKLLAGVIDEGARALKGPNTAVLLIDMQETATPKEWKQLARKQLAVLELANKRGLPVFEARRTLEFSQSMTLPVLKNEIAKSSDAYEFTRLTGNALEGMDARGGLRMRETLLAYDIGTAIVMGQESNQCIAATIFGQLFSGRTAQGQEPPRYLGGLLDAGISVVTSRAIIHPKELEPAYTFVDIGKQTDIATVEGIAGLRTAGAGPLDPATKAHMDAALDVPD
jgi:hypothetical protein